MISQEKMGNLIATLRKEKKMTQEQLAEKLGVSNRSISRWEKGKTMPDISMLPSVGEILGVSVTELLNGERTMKEAKLEESIGMMTELFEQEKRKQSKMVNRCFAMGFICLILVIMHQQFGIFNFTKEADILMIMLAGFGILCEITGFYYNSHERKYTRSEMLSFLGAKESVNMKTPGEMIQFAKRNQNVDYPQYKKAFRAIAEKVLPEEQVTFSMVADSCVVNDNWANNWRPWHVAIVVTDRRLLICGETMHGMMMTFYDVESFDLEDLLSVELVKQKIIIKFVKDELAIEGKALETIIDLLKNALKIESV